MRPLRWLALCALVLGLSACPDPPAGPQVRSSLGPLLPAAVVALSPAADESWEVGSVIELRLWLDLGPLVRLRALSGVESLEVGALRVPIRFDPERLAFDTALGESGVESRATAGAADEPGLVRLVAFATADGAEPAQQPVVARVRFRALAAGSTSVVVPSEGLEVASRPTLVHGALVPPRRVSARGRATTLVIGEGG